MESLILPGDKNVELIDVCLYDSLPVPQPGTPFEDILQFKLKYSSELEALRVYLDELRENILSSVDEERAIKTSLSKVNSALEDIDNSLKSASISTVTDTISLITENPSFGFWAAIGAGVASSQGMPVEVGLTAGGGLATMFQFFKRITKGGNNIPNPKAEFTYLRRVNQKFT